MADTIFDWSSTASSNGNADAEINFAEGQPPSSVNDSSRMVMKRIRDFITDTTGILLTTGLASAYQLATASNPDGYFDGWPLTFQAHTNNLAGATLNVNSLGARPIVVSNSAGPIAISTSLMTLNGKYSVVYQSGTSSWLLLNPNRPSREVGEVADYAGTVQPAGWLFCWGQAVSRTTYADLYAVIGTTFGAGNGTTTFNLPDLRGRVIAGKDNMGGTSADRLTALAGGLDGDVLGATGGAQSHTLTEAQIPAHTHIATVTPDGAHSHTMSGRSGADTSGGGNQTISVTPGNGATNTTSVAPNHTHAVTLSNTGSGQAHNNVQPTLILNKIIKF